MAAKKKLAWYAIVVLIFAVFGVFVFIAAMVRGFSSTTTSSSSSKWQVAFNELKEAVKFTNV